MESVGSSSYPPEPPSPNRFSPTQPIGDRVIRALRHRLLLLHRSDSMFFILGATGNVYTVNLSTTLSCSCPDRTIPCKHILFVLIRVLGVPLDDSCLWRRRLRPCKLNRLLALPTLNETLAGAGIRERFHQMFFQARIDSNNSIPSVEIEEGTNCPICLEELKKDDEQQIVACGTCRNPVHEECLMAWKRSSRRRSISCVLCRAKWRISRNVQDKYLNLSAYLSEDNSVEGGGDARCSD